MALAILRHHGSAKHSVRTRKMLAAVNDDYRFSLISPPLALIIA
jgi:hypothetical protein